MAAVDLSGYSDAQLQQMLAAAQAQRPASAPPAVDLSGYSDEQLQAMLDARKAQRGAAPPADDGKWWEAAAAVDTPVRSGGDPYAAFTPVPAPPQGRTAGGDAWWENAPVVQGAPGRAVDPYAGFTPVQPSPGAAAQPRLVPVDHDPVAQAGGAAPPTVTPAPTNSAAAAAVSGAIDGVPLVGPYLLGGMQRLSAFQRSMDAGTRYDDELRTVQDADRARQQDHPYATMAGNVAGAGLAMAPAAAAVPALVGGGSAPLLARAATSGVANAALGGADAAVRSGGDLVSTGLGAGYRRLMGRAVEEAPGVPASARQYLVDRIRADDPAAVLANMRDLGDQGMLADYGPGLRGIAQGLATKPGPGQQAVMAPLTVRNAGTNARLDAAVTGALGPDQSPAGYQRAIGDAIAPHARAQQAALAGAGPIDVTEAYARLDNAIRHAAPGTPEHAALHEARASLAAPDGVTRDARQVYSARQGMDDRIDYSGPGGPAPSSAVRSAQGAYRQARGDLDAALRDQVPGYAEPTDAIRGLSQRRDAVDAGMASLNMRPDDLAAQFGALTPEQQRDFAVGQRSLISRAFGTKENDLQALRNFMQGEQGWNLQNTATVHGQDVIRRGILTPV